MQKHRPHRRRPAAPVERCIFWEEGKAHSPLTEEHIWGKWLKNVVRSVENKHRLRHTQIGRPGTPTTDTISHRAGGPLGAKVKIICRECNNGWMSAIQNAAKPFLMPLIRGQKSILGSKAQQAIAAWCAMATMTGEYQVRDPTAISITQAERNWLRDNGTPPPNWKIWIGRVSSPVSVWHHYVVPLAGSAEFRQSSPRDLDTPNTQTTTFVVGNFLAHVMSSQATPDTVSQWNWPWNSQIGLCLPRIYPAKESIIIWPDRALSNREVAFVSEAFERVVEEAALSPFTGHRMF